jgi:Ca-activated chloride channel family protein
MHRLTFPTRLPAHWIGFSLGAPQLAPDQHPTISVETNLVMLPVTVVDRRGQFVGGLTREQFTVFDNDEAQPIQFFTSEDIPTTVGLVIDCSSSMRTRRADVTAAGTAFAESAHPLDELFTLNFNEAVWPGLPPGMTFADNPAQLHRALARAPANGMTALYDAIDRALDYLQLGTRDRRALIVVSDGGDNASSHTLASVLDIARRTNAIIHAVSLPDEDRNDAKPDVLRKLAHETGGTVFSPKNADGVRRAFEEIGRDLRSGYMLGLSPPEGNDGFRTIRVVADAGDGRALTARTRAGYYAAGHQHGTK